jgi:SAM-dependent methyltransferase
MIDKYKVIKDGTFGYHRLDPIPTQEEVEKFYLEEFYSTKYKYFNNSALSAQKESQDFYKGHWDNILFELKKHLGFLDGKSLFDIGFGFAQAMLYFRSQGFCVSGLEPSPEGFDYAKEQGLDVHRSGIEDFSCVGNKRFDVVTIFNVLEHLRDPAHTLMNVGKKLLKPGGVLVIDVPNDFNDFQLIGNAEFGLDDWWVCPPNHINYFSPTSLGSLLERCGYKVLRMESSFPLEMFLLMGDVYVGNAQLGKVCHKKRTLFESLLRKHGKSDKLKNLYQALAKLDLGRQVTVWSVKVD